jgi:hypothetical protein
MDKQWVKTCLAVLHTLATNHSTYRFVGLLAVAFGVVQGGHLVEAFEDIVCVLLGGCA